MKKLIWAMLILAVLVLFGFASMVSASYFDTSLAKVWIERKDLQKAFPGDPSNNVKLEKWAKERGWKESPELFNYYPDKAVVEKIIDNKVEARIAALESQVATLNSQLYYYKSQTVQQVVQTVAGAENSRLCYLSGLDGKVLCPLNTDDYKSYDNGKVPVYFLVK